MPHEPLRALLVDVGGTLVDNATWLKKGPIYETHMISRLREAFGTGHPWFVPLATHRFVESDTPSWEQRTVEVVTAMLAEHGYQASAEDVERICRACAAPLGQVVELSDGALEAIQAIRNLGVRMVICSNTLWRTMPIAGATGRSSASASTSMLTSPPTTPATPSRTRRCSNAPWRRSWRDPRRRRSSAIIGDRPELDLAGARSVGMRSIWMRPPDFVAEPDPAPDAVVGGWSEVPPIIEQWLTGPGGKRS